MSDFDLSPEFRVKEFWNWMDCNVKQTKLSPFLAMAPHFFTHDASLTRKQRILDYKTIAIEFF